MKHTFNFLKYVFVPGDIVELRCQVKDGSIMAGRFDNFEKMAWWAAEVLSGPDMAGDIAAIWYVINPIAPEAAKRVGAWNANEMKHKCRTTRDCDVQRRSLYVIDFDPVRPKGVCSTDQEKRKAYGVLLAVKAFFQEQGWPAPLLVDSGNGFHAYYRGDGGGPNSDTWKYLLGVLSEMFGTDEVKIDTSVFNAARVMRLPGTWNKKGENTQERPHRQCKVIQYPAKWEPVPNVYKLAAKHGYLTPEERSAHRHPGSSTMPPLVDDIEAAIDEFCQDFNLDIAFNFKKDGVTYFALRECPFAGRTHSGGPSETCITLSDTSVGFHCFAGDCSHFTFQDLRRHLEETNGYKSDVQFYDHIAIEDDDAFWGAIEAWGVEDLDADKDEPQDDEDDETETDEASGIEEQDDDDAEVIYTREDLLALKRMLPYPDNVRFTHDEIDLISNWNRAVAV